MSVDSGLSGPAEGPVAPAAPRAGTSPRVAPSRPARPGAARADALADAISPPSFRTGRGRPRRRGRRATRIVRRIELWSVLKIALVFNTILLGIVLGSVALLWGLANTTGLVDDLEGFLRDAGFEDFRFQGEQMFERVAFIGAVGALAATVFMVLATALLNLISEITGGIRFVVIEEIVEQPAEPARAPAPLALPTVAPAPPTGPPPSAPRAAASNGRSERRPAPQTDADAGPLSEARVAMAKPSPSSSGSSPGGSAAGSTARSRSGPAKKAAGRGPTAKGGGRRSSPPKPKPKPAPKPSAETPPDPAGASNASSSRRPSPKGGSGSAPTRRVRRPRPASSDAAGDDVATGRDDASS